MPQSPQADLLEAGPPSGEPTTPKTGRYSGRGWLTVSLLLLLLVLAILPPLISISRYQRRIATSMSQVLGRPVHLDHVALNLLPFPSLTLSNLVIDELPPFGTEPLVRANTVNAQLRLLPLWRHRVEFSRITFADPSVNLVRLSTGRWNLESVLLQAAHMDAAPTTQRSIGGQPRFPYIEATGARVNLKFDQQKTPFSLTDADFALWLPQPREWRVRLRGHPSRTDTSASDTGTVRVEATLQRATAVGEVPISLDGSWTGAPLGEASRVVTGHDAGLRGDLRLTTHLQGTLKRASLSTDLELSDLHRVDLVPDRPVSVNLACRAVMTHLLHSAEDLHCAWPLESGSGGMLRVDGALPDLLAPASADLRLSADRVPAGTVLRWMRAATSNLPPDLQATGQMAAEVTYSGTETPATAEMRISDLALSGASLNSVPVTFSPILLTATIAGIDQGSTNRTPDQTPGRIPDRIPEPSSPVSPGAAAELSMSPATVHLGESGDDPTGAGELVVSLGADRQGLSARLAGTAIVSRLEDLAASLPMLGEGLRVALPLDPSDAPVAVDLTAHRPWGGAQRWTNLQDLPALPPSKAPPTRHHPR